MFPDSLLLFRRGLPLTRGAHMSHHTTTSVRRGPYRRRLLGAVPGPAAAAPASPGPSRVGVQPWSQPRAADPRSEVRTNHTVWELPVYMLSGVSSFIVLPPFHLGFLK